MATETVAKPPHQRARWCPKVRNIPVRHDHAQYRRFIAWGGLITALFIEKGWIPVAELGGFGTTPRVIPTWALSVQWSRTSFRS